MQSIAIKRSAMLVAHQRRLVALRALTNFAEPYGLWRPDLVWQASERPSLSDGTGVQVKGCKHSSRGKIDQPDTGQPA
jgi:hypothetical protein